MSEPIPTPNQDTQLSSKQETLPSLFNCLTGVLISGGFAIALYFVTSSIAQAFASKPIASTNQTAINIAIAIRTLVVGLSTLATIIFGVIAVGLVLVTIQVFMQQLKNRKTSHFDAE